MRIPLPFAYSLRRLRIALLVIGVIDTLGLVAYFTIGKDVFSSPVAVVLLALILALVGALTAINWQSNWAMIAATGALVAVGLVLANYSPFLSIPNVSGYMLLTLASMLVFALFIENVPLRLLGLFPVGAIARATYYEALLQPFTLIMLLAGIAMIGTTSRLGFFTYNEDFKMYRDVASSFVFLFSLPVMIFAATKVIDEEIENRTMLTLMSKPVSRTQVILGKYLGVLMIVLASVAVLSIMACVCSYLRYFDDMAIDYRLAQSNAATMAQLNFDNFKAFLALLPSLTLTFLQLATLAAISVAVSTRFGLAANVTTVVVIYIAASLARYVGNAPELPLAVRGTINLFAYILPGLSSMDLNQRLIFSTFILGESDWAPNTPTYGLIWRYVGMATVYAAFYSSAVLSFGVALFRSRELT